ncbi:prepilin peptidase [Actinoplanes sp. CA-054009]
MDSDGRKFDQLQSVGDPAMCVEARHSRGPAASSPSVGQIARLTILLIAVAPAVRWTILYYSVPARQQWQRVCPHCATPFGTSNWLPLTPLGRCGHCRHKVGSPPCTAETVLLLAAIGCSQLPPWIIPAYAWWAAIGTALLFIDIAVHRLPDRLTWPAAGGFLLLAGLAAPHGHSEAWLRSGLSAVLLTVILGTCALLWPRGLGRGDVKYGAAIGAAAGWTSWLAVYSAIVVATLLGALAGIVLVIARQASRRTQLPFGPFLFLGTVLVVALVNL